MSSSLAAPFGGTAAMSTSRVESMAVVLGLFAMGACSAAESKGDVDFDEQKLNHSGGRADLGEAGGYRAMGGGSSTNSGGGGSTAAGGGGGSGGGTAKCLTSQPKDGIYCSNVGMECHYPAVCICQPQSTSGGSWKCTAASGSGGGSSSGSGGSGNNGFGN
jgi:hypothetical protein